MSRGSPRKSPPAGSCSVHADVLCPSCQPPLETPESSRAQVLTYNQNTVGRRALLSATAVGGSVFLLDCKNCRVSVAAKQLRVRDCFDCEFRVFAPKSEGSVIETSKRLTFGCWDVAYPSLAAQFAAARLDAFGRNHWDKVYDFSPPEAPAPPNWAEMPLAPMVTHRWAELEPKPEARQQRSSAAIVKGELLSTPTLGSPLAGVPGKNVPALPLEGKCGWALDW